MDNLVYTLELARWNVYNDRSHPIETTNGINQALIWSKENGYKTFVIPDGVYLIAKGSKQNDPEARINMVGDMELVLSSGTVLEKESNQYEIYSVLYLSPNVRNVKISGGTIRGDRDTHDYSVKGPYTSGTHEWGYGIELVGAENIKIDGVKLEKFTGDGIIVSATTITGSTITEAELEAGGIDDQGMSVQAPGKIRTKSRTVTNFDNKAYEKYRNIYFWLPQGVKEGSRVDVAYYRKDGSFIKIDRQVKFYNGESIIPDGADYFRAVFEADSISGVKVSRMTVAISKNVQIENCDIGFNRRQGISLVGSDGVEILNNTIHHTQGTKPESGIDIEPGFYPGRNTLIKGNTFLGNKIQIVLAYGENVIIEENLLEQSQISGAVGIHSHADFKNVLVKKNKFNGSGLTVYSSEAIVESNEFFNGEIKLLGNKIFFRNSSLVDTNLNIGSMDNQKISRVLMKNSGEGKGNLYLGNRPIRIENLILKAKSNGKTFISGYGHEDSIYEHVIVEDVDGKGTLLPVGQYRHCSFAAGPLSFNRAGHSVLENCHVLSSGNLLSINSTYGAPFVNILNSTFEITGNIGYGAAVYVLGAENFELFNCQILAPNNTVNTPLIKIGPYGSPKPTKILAVSIIGNMIYTKTGISGIDTSNAGTDAPAYYIEGNVLYNAKLKLTDKDIDRYNDTLSH